MNAEETLRVDTDSNADSNATQPLLFDDDDSKHQTAAADCPSDSPFPEAAATAGQKRPREIEGAASVPLSLSTGDHTVSVFY